MRERSCPRSGRQPAARATDVSHVDLDNGPAAASAAPIPSAFASRFMRSTQRITLTRCVFQGVGMVRPGVRPMAAASFAAGASAIPCWISGSAPVFGSDPPAATVNAALPLRAPSMEACDRDGHAALAFDSCLRSPGNPIGLRASVIASSWEGFE